MPYLKTKEGRKIYYRKKGQGQPLVFLHGLSENSSHFYEQEEFFTNEGYQVISFDAAGHGRSDSLEDKLDALETWICDLSRILNYLNINENNKCAVIGHSLGGAITLFSGSRLKEKIAAIGTLDSSYTIYDSFLKLIYWKVYTLVVKMLVKSKMLNLAYRTFLKITDSKLKECSEELKKEKLNNIYHESYETALKEIKSLEKYRNGILLKKLKDITVPSFILCGEKDLLTPPKLSKKMAKEIPNSELCIIPGNYLNAGHDVYKAQPEEVNKRLLRFLRKNFPKK